MRHFAVDEILEVLKVPTVDRTRELLADAPFSREAICDERVRLYSLYPEHFAGLRDAGLEEQLRGALELYGRYSELRDYVLVPRARDSVRNIHSVLEQGGFHPSQWFMFGGVAAGKFSPDRSDIDIGVVMPPAECDDPRFIHLLRDRNLPGTIPLNRWDMRIEITRYSEEWMARRLELEASRSVVDELVKAMLRDGGARIPLTWNE